VLELTRQAITSEGLAQGHYVEAVTLQMQGTELTTEPPHTEPPCRTCLLGGTPSSATTEKDGFQRDMMCKKRVRYDSRH